MMEPYSYTPLDSAGSQIRLLTIPRDIKQTLGRANVKPLSGRISNHYLPHSSLSRARRLYRVAQLPVYVALSYVWGTSAQTREILIDGKKLGITANLYEALRAIQKNAVGDVMVWADAICICQSNLDERSAQILLMREIYHSADEVRIYLGPGSQDGLKCLKFITDLTGASITVDDPTNTEDDAVDEVLERVIQFPVGILLDSLSRAGQVFTNAVDVLEPSARDGRAKMLTNPDDKLSLYQNSIEDVSEWRPKPRRLKLVEDENLQEMAGLLRTVFIQNDWFSRMWVVQELGVSGTVYLQLGGIAIAWRYVVRAIYYLHFVVKIRIDTIRRVTGMEKIRLAWNRSERQPLLDLVRECRYKEATDPRDKIFSLLGLMGDQVNQYLQPDYSKPVGQIFTGATRHFISQSKLLDPICGWQRIGGREEPSWKLPSWTPDYTLDQEMAPAPLVPIDGRPSIYSASGYDHRSMHLLEDNLEDSEWSELRVTGLQVDDVIVLSDPGYQDDNFGVVARRWRETILTASSLLNELTEDVLGCLEDLSSIVAKYSDWAHLTDRNFAKLEELENGPANHEIYILDAYLQTLLSGRISSQERITKENIQNILNMAICNASKDGADCSRDGFFTMVCNTFNAGTAMRKLVVTQNGYIGAVPQETQLGDLICVLFGCSVPVVLRRTQEGTFMFVGESYVHGLMDGEGIAFQVKGLLEEQRFTLK